MSSSALVPIWTPSISESPKTTQWFLYIIVTLIIFLLLLVDYRSSHEMERFKSNSKVCACPYTPLCEVRLNIRYFLVLWYFKAFVLKFPNLFLEKKLTWTSWGTSSRWGRWWWGEGRTGRTNISSSFPPTSSSSPPPTGSQLSSTRYGGASKLMLKMPKRSFQDCSFS